MIAARRGRPDLIERPPRPLAGPGRLLRDLGPLYAANGLIGMIFSATGPVAVILAVGTAGRLSPAELASWIFGVFFLNGLLTVLACWLYRQPLAFFWTIPGTVLVGPALGHLSFAEVVGAYYATGLLMLVLGLSGWVRRAMAAVLHGRPSSASTSLSSIIGSQERRGGARAGGGLSLICAPLPA